MSVHLTLHGIEGYTQESGIYVVVSKVHNSKKSFSNVQQTGLVGGCNKFLTLFKMKVVQGHLVYSYLRRHL
jgi:hypothetical protein